MANKKLKQYFFQHDAFAREDPKLIRVRMEYGSAGYGVYFMLLEYLFSQPNYMSETTYNAIGYNLHESAGMVKSIVEDFGLFTLSPDGKWFHSESFSKRMASLDSAACSRSSAAAKAAKARWSVAPTIHKPKNDASRMRHACKNDASRMRHASENDANNIILDKDIVVNDINSNTESMRKQNSVDGMQPCRYKDELYKEQSFWESSAMRFHRKVEELKPEIEKFQLEVIAQDTQHQSYSDYRRHFFNWLRIQIQESEKNATDNSTGRSSPGPQGKGSKADFNAAAEEQARTAILRIDRGLEQEKPGF